MFSVVYIHVYSGIRLIWTLLGQKKVIRQVSLLQGLKVHKYGIWEEESVLFTNREVSLFQGCPLRRGSTIYMYTSGFLPTEFVRGVENINNCTIPMQPSLLLLNVSGNCLDSVEELSLLKHLTAFIATDNNLTSMKVL